MRPGLGRLLTGGVFACASAVVTWQVLRLAAGDRWWWLALANTFSLYVLAALAILPPLLCLAGVLLAGINPNWRIWLVSSVPGVWLLVLYGGLFLPQATPTTSPAMPVLRVMSFNVLGSTNDGALLESWIRLSRGTRGAEGPDLICLQELNHRLASDLVNRLSDRYPHHVLLPEEGVTGLGIFSRHPMTDLGEIPDPAWQHGAQVVMVSYAGQEVLVLNVHAWPSWTPVGSSFYTWADFDESFRLREAQSRRWLEWVDRHPGPAILAGDLNTTDQNASYRILAGSPPSEGGAGLRDMHRSVGWGFGHTFPSEALGWGPVVVPARLLRLDYVLYSRHWQPRSARVCPSDGQSDHRALFAELVLATE